MRGVGGRDTRTPVDDAADPEKRRAELRGLLLRVLAGVGGFFVLVALLARTLREPLRALGASFVDRFGLAGLFVGTFAADAFSCPVPPQFYLLTAITSGHPQAPAFGVISLASLLAGFTGYRMAGHLARVPLFFRLLERTRGGVDGLIERWGPWAILVASISPLPFSGLCYTAGFYRMPWRLFGVFLLLRVPRLLVFYAALRAGWAL